MEYILKFYEGDNRSNVNFLGSLLLDNEYTYNHYLNFPKTVENSIWFDSFDPEKPYGNAIINSEAIISPFEEGNTKGILIILQQKYFHFLTQEEWNNEEGMKALMSKLKKADLTRFFK